MKSFPIVGIGASAGGIEALGQFFDAVPEASGMAFVVVLHLDPNRESQMSAVLRTHTTMPVAQIEDGMTIASDHVYVIAPDSYLRVRDRVCRLSKPDEPRGHRFPVDVLFTSLAEDQGERAICVVLSGTGHNGTQGLREVKGRGGCALVQDPHTAKFDGMPRSAIDADLADQVLAPDKMPAFLVNYVAHDYLASPSAIDGEKAENALTLDPILALLRARSEQDFRSYKRSTLSRRVHRRMGLTNSESLTDYLALLRGSDKELAALARDMLISVTSFFRDPEAWEALRQSVIAPLVAERATGAPVRVWVPACATGEEAYTIGMLFLETAEAAGKQFDLKIFATDSQTVNLNVARSGIYPDAGAATVSPERQRRFFERLDGTFEVRRELRERVIFSPHNLLRDPPFSRMDVISCRNLMIYLQPEAQKRVVTLAHFALRPDGHLFLGNAETVGRADELFDTVSKKWRIYRRIGATRHDIVNFPVFSNTSRAESEVGRSPPHNEDRPQPRFADVARRTLLERHAPASVLIDGKGRALYFHGATGPYLEAPPGEPTRDLVAMAREGLRFKLRVALRQAIASHAEHGFTARFREDDLLREVDVTVTPAHGSGAAPDLMLVSFAPRPEAPKAAPPGEADIDSGRNQRALEEELMATRAELRNTAEQMESANEELKAYNEESTSMNEELQSTNEELETSKEELQSFNEELHSVNNQLQHKVSELEQSTNTLDNLLSGTEIATIFLNADLRIKWFSPASRALLDLVNSDIGRPIANFALKIDDPDLLSDAGAVLAKLAPIEAVVRDATPNWYLRRILPYRTRDNRIEGVVVTFVDITERKRAADAVEEARIFSEAIVQTMRQPLLVLDADLRVLSANRAFYEAFKVARHATEGHLLYELGDGQWDIPQLRDCLEDILPDGHGLSEFVVEQSFETIGERTMVLNARRLERNGGAPGQILLAIEDTTERTRALAHQKLLIDELSHRVKNVLATVHSLANRTMGQAKTLDEFRSAFEGRLLALSRAHDLLVEQDWTGADLGQLARRTLDPYRGHNDDQITIEGPRLLVDPKTCTALVLILHELATNAAKYGALSTADGALDLRWELHGGNVELIWSEDCRRTISAPEGQGFGTRLVQGSASFELKGQARFDYRAEGLRCEVIFPLKAAAPRPPDNGQLHA